MDLFGRNYRAKYHEAILQAAEWKGKYIGLKDIYNALVMRINRHGGEDLFDSKLDNQFTKEELKTIFILCHPDKHNDSIKSIKMSQRIGEIRSLR